MVFRRSVGVMRRVLALQQRAVDFEHAVAPDDYPTSEKRIAGGDEHCPSGARRIVERILDCHAVAGDAIANRVVGRIHDIDLYRRQGAAIAGDPARSPPLSNNAKVLSVAVVLRIGDIYYLRACNFGRQRLI